MATFKKFNKDKRPKRNTQSLLFKRKRFCRFTVTGVEEIDYKDNTKTTRKKINLIQKLEMKY